MISAKHKVKGISCASCALSIESMLRPIKGVLSAEVNYADSTVRINYDENETNIHLLADELRKIGYTLVLDNKEAEKVESDELNVAFKKLVWAAIFALPVFVIEMFLSNYIPYHKWIAAVLTFAVMFFPGRSFFTNALSRAKQLTANMDTLVALSTSVAFVASFINTIWPNWLGDGFQTHVYFESAAVIIFFILFGKYLEARAKHKSGEAIKKLMQLQPKFVRVIRNGEEIDIEIDKLVVNDRIIVKSGSNIPVDGKVIKGITTVDESSITGESMAVDKKRGDQVFAGTINQSGSLIILAEQLGKDTLLGAMIQAVEKAQSSKAPVQLLVDKIAAVFVPVVLIIALITAVIWLFVGAENAYALALTSLVSVLVIACPCALGLATPTAIMVGVGQAALKGILIKNAESLEHLKDTQVLIIDKTGTLTSGKPTVDELIWPTQILEEQKEAIWQKLYSIEKLSEHPLASSIVKHALALNTQSIEVERFKSYTGQGVEAVIAGESFFVGEANWVQKQANIQIVETELHSSSSKIYFAKSNENLLCVAISDQLKSTSKQAIQQLQNMQIKIVLASGDAENAVEKVAKECGIKEYYARVKPSEKADLVKKYQADGYKVCMVGDGVNDAEALSLANASIAMGHGTDVAIDVAGISLVKSDILDVSKAIIIAKQTSKTIKQNLFWAFIYNVIGIPIAAGILYPFNGFLLNPMIAGAAMAFSSVSVVSNSLLLKYKTKKI